MIRLVRCGHCGAEVAPRNLPAHHTGRRCRRAQDTVSAPRWFCVRPGTIVSSLVAALHDLHRDPCIRRLRVWCRVETRDGKPFDGLFMPRWAFYLGFAVVRAGPLIPRGPERLRDRADIVRLLLTYLELPESDRRRVEVIGAAGGYAVYDYLVATGQLDVRPGAEARRANLSA